MDNDDDYDLLVGNMNGNIFFYENIGDIYNYDFQLNDANFQNINVGTRSMPLGYDYDGDGDLDLLIGSGSNDIICYENSGNFTFYYNESESLYNLGKNSSPELYNSLNHRGLVVGLSTGGMYFSNGSLENKTFLSLSIICIASTSLINFCVLRNLTYSFKLSFRNLELLFVSNAINIISASILSLTS